jgi:hypothetical protein
MLNLALPAVIFFPNVLGLTSIESIHFLKRMELSCVLFAPTVRQSRIILEQRNMFRRHITVESKQNTRIVHPLVAEHACNARPHGKEILK